MRAPSPYSAFVITTNEPGHIDIAMPEGTLVVALRGGIVTHSGWDDSHGWSVLLLESDGSLTRYAHFKYPPVVGLGSEVVAQQKLGLSGNTGISTGPHLHLRSVDANGNPIDPFRSSGINWNHVAAGVGIAAVTLFLIAG